MNNTNNIEVYVATHKKFDLLGDRKIYIPIQGGAELYSDERFGYVLDNKGDNISLKKENYNELTSIYWVWKNSKADIKGLCHYRRYFTRKSISVDTKYIINKETIINTMKDYDAILPIPFFHKQYTNYEYCIKGSVKEKDLNMLRDIVSEIYPEYLESYDIVMQQNYACYCNSLIAKRKIFDSYSNWLFSILEEAEKRTDLTGYSEAEIRIFGYLGELLLNVWFHNNKIKTKYYYMRVYGLKKTKNYNLKCFLEKIGLSAWLNKIKYRDWKEYKSYYNS